MADRWMIQGAGTGADSDATNGGGFEIGTAATWANAQEANGGPVQEVTGGTYADGATDDVIGKTGAFLNTVVGHWAYIQSASRNAGVPDRVQITARTNHTITFLTVNWGAGDDDLVVNVGGSLPATDVGWQAAFDLASAGDFVDATPGTHLFDASVTVDGTIGTAAARITVRGVDVSGSILTVGDTLPLIIVKTAHGALNAGLFHIAAADATDYWDFQFLHINADGGGSDVADYCFFNDDEGSSFIRWFQCELEGAAINNFHTQGTRGLIVNCKSHDATGAGFLLSGIESEIRSCSAYDNGTDGIAIEDRIITVTGCECYGNTGDGLSADANARTCTIANNVFYGNSINGLDIHSSTNNMKVYNNAFVGNSAYGLVGGAVETFDLLANNLNFGNGIAYANLSGAITDASVWEASSTLDYMANSAVDPQFIAPTATPPNFNIGNPDALQGGLLTPGGQPSLIGAATMILTGVNNRLRMRFSDSTHGYKLTM